MLFNQPFHDNTVDGPAGSVSLPASPTGVNAACLSAAGNATANPQIPTTLGQPGGALGYSAKNSATPGLTDGYLGVGIDTYGNFSNKYEGTGCTDPANIAQQMTGQVVVRGPGNGTVGYCPLSSSAATATSPPLALRSTTRADSVVPVEVVYNPSSATVTTPSGLVVPAGDYAVHFTPVGGPAKNLSPAFRRPTGPAAAATSRSPAPTSAGRPRSRSERPRNSQRARRRS